MSEMIERVAKSLERFLPAHVAVEAAKDAIRAMRDPDAVMVDAGWAQNDASPAACWTAMIEAALRD